MAAGPCGFEAKGRGAQRYCQKCHTALLTSRFGGKISTFHAYPVAVKHFLDAKFLKHGLYLLRPSKFAGYGPVIWPLAGLRITGAIHGRSKY
jgi:hypothetical protein